MNTQVPLTQDMIDLSASTYHDLFKVDMDTIHTYFKYVLKHFSKSPAHPCIVEAFCDAIDNHVIGLPEVLYTAFLTINRLCTILDEEQEEESPNEESQD